MRLAKILNEDPGAIHAGDLTNLRRQVEKLVSLIENQLYCIAGLNASDNEAVQEPHRKAYIQDLVSEVEIAQRGIYRLEARVNDLHAYYQMAGSDRVEKRLRILTIVSAPASWSDRRTTRDERRWVARLKVPVRVHDRCHLDGRHRLDRVVVLQTERLV